jgi:hypothetical protein
MFCGKDWVRKRGFKLGPIIQPHFGHSKRPRIFHGAHYRSLDNAATTMIPAPYCVASSNRFDRAPIYQRASRKALINHQQLEKITR